MELKEASLSCESVMTLGLNCTFMELKEFYDKSHKIHDNALIVPLWN